MDRHFVSWTVWFCRSAMPALGPGPSAPVVGATRGWWWLLVEHHAALGRERQELLGNNWREAETSPPPLSSVVISVVRVFPGLLLT